MSSEVDRQIEMDASATKTDPMDKKDPFLTTPGTGTQITIKKDPSGNLTGALLLRNPIHLHAQLTRIRTGATTAISTGIFPENAHRTKRTLRN